MKRFATNSALLAGLAVLVCACQRTPGEVVQKIKYDFGIGERPAGYVTGSEKVMAGLRSVGETEMKRMNVANRHGEVKFQEEQGLQGKYYKEVKVYESCYPLEARPITRTAEGERGYVGYIEYLYRLHESERKISRADAEAVSATIPTDRTGRETYRYKFSTGGVWDGREGEPTK